MSTTTTKRTKKDNLKTRLESGELVKQKSWKFVMELNSSEESLSSIAIDDGRREYTYRQFFRQWEKYAEVFSALGITEKNKARLGVLSSPAAEPVFSFYAANMTGASVSMLSFLDLENRRIWNKLIEKEHITDLVLCDSMLRPDILQRIINDKDSLGLRNVIVLHIRIAGPFAAQWMTLQSRMNYQKLKLIKGALFMDELLEKYETTPIEYGRGKLRDDAIIIHTSGTTNGVHKPIPLSDLGYNEAVARHMRDKEFFALRGKTISCLGMDLSASYGAVDMMHLPFAFGGKVVTIPMGHMNPRFAAAVSHYKVNLLHSAPALLDSWVDMPTPLDLSNLKYVWIGGGYVSPDAKKRYNEFFKKCGSEARVAVGYGLAEIGAACIIASPDRDDDAIGYPMAGVKVKIYDENNEKYYDLEDGPRTGVLFLSSPSVSSGRIDDTVFFELDKIDGETYLNTYDLVRVNDDGSLNCVGRMNKYFVNNEGVRFDAGLVETAVSAQPGILDCGLVPGYDKIIHDTFPILYVKVRESGMNALNTVRTALSNVFIRDNKIKETNLPGQCVIAEHLPLTTTGKVDVYQIVNKGVKGTKYKIEPIRVQGNLIDIQFIQIPNEESGPGFWAGIPEELTKDIDDMSKLFSNMAGEFQMPQIPQMPQGFQMPQMPQMTQGYQMPQMPQMPQMTQGYQMPQMPQGYLMPQMLQGFQMPQMPQMPQGFSFPGMPAQGTNEKPQQGFSMPDMNYQMPQMPQMAQGYQMSQMPQMPQGFTFPGKPAQGTNEKPQQGFPMPDMNYQMPQKNGEQAKPDGMQMLDFGPITNLMGMLFNASNIDYFFED